MTIINRYITREILKLFLLMLIGLTTIFMGFTASVQLQQAAAELLPVSAALQLIFLNTLIALEILLPTTLFFAGIAALARMQSDHETTVILSTGASPLQIALPVLSIAIIVALLAGLLSIFARPWAYNLSYQLESDTVAELNIKALVPRQFIELSSSGHILYARDVNQAEGYAEDVFVQRDASDSLPYDLVISARQARLLPLNLASPPVLQFNDGQLYRLDPIGSQDFVLEFGELKIPLPEDEALSEYRRKAVPTATLALSGQARDIAEYQWRLVTPLITLFLAVLCVPLTTGNPGQSRSLSMLSALVAYALIFGLTGVLRTAVEQKMISATPGLWLAPLIPALILLGYNGIAQFRNPLR